MNEKKNPETERNETKKGSLMIMMIFIMRHLSVIGMDEIYGRRSGQQ